MNALEGGCRVVDSAASPYGYVAVEESRSQNQRARTRATPQRCSRDHLLATTSSRTMKRTRDDIEAPHDGLAALGYAFLPGPGGDPSDWVLRQLGAPGEGFAWRGQEDYDALGAAAVRWVRGALVGLCGLEPLSGHSPAVPYATPGLREHTGPLCIFVCGSIPGGDAGVWGRSLCINKSTAEGAIPARRREPARPPDSALAQRGAAVVVLQRARRRAQVRRASWPSPLGPALASRPIVSAARGPAGALHGCARRSYGAPLAIHLLKAEAEALTRVAAIAFTDGMAWDPSGWTGGFDRLLCEVRTHHITPEPSQHQSQHQASPVALRGQDVSLRPDPHTTPNLHIHPSPSQVAPDDDDSMSAAVKAHAARQRRYKEAAPLAFAPATGQVQASGCVALSLRGGCGEPHRRSHAMQARPSRGMQAWALTRQARPSPTCHAGVRVCVRGAVQASACAAACAPQARLARISTNFVASAEPMGTPLPSDPSSDTACAAPSLHCVSAGAESHPSTTHAATEAVFDFLSKRAAEA
eukprot:4283300-Prymnesium_polylepis.1